MSTRTLPQDTESTTGGEPPWRDDEEAAFGGGDFTPPPRRPRRRLVTPVTAGLAALLVAALGFLGGVEVQKHSTAAAPSFARGANGGGPPSGGFAGGAPGGGQTSGTQGTTGTVSYVKNGVIYVKDGDGNTLKVKVSDGVDVTRTAATTAGKVHPGDTVVVQGRTSGSTVTATSVTATAKTG